MSANDAVSAAPALVPPNGAPGTFEVTMYASGKPILTVGGGHV